MRQRRAICRLCGINRTQPCIWWTAFNEIHSAQSGAQLAIVASLPRSALERQPLSADFRVSNVRIKVYHRQRPILFVLILRLSNWLLLPASSGQANRMPNRRVCMQSASSSSRLPFIFSARLVSPDASPDRLAELSESVAGRVSVRRRASVKLFTAFAPSGHRNAPA